MKSLYLDLMVGQIVGNGLMECHTAAGTLEKERTSQVEKKTHQVTLVVHQTNYSL